VFKEQILQMAECCPNLEHLGFSLIFIGQNYVVNIPDLVALHQFRQLSSLDISMAFPRFNDIQKVIELNWIVIINLLIVTITRNPFFFFNQMVCPGGERADMAFLDILTKLDQINPLRVIHFIYSVKIIAKIPIPYAEFGFQVRRKVYSSI
jgi:hypothetical protein